MRRVLILLLSLLSATPTLGVGLLQDEEPAFIDLGRSLVHYATIARDDGSFRRLWIDEVALGKPGDALPDGTSIAMETFYGPENRATVFIKEKRDGKWLYGSFEPGKPDWTDTKTKTVCHACHIDAKADLTFTLPVIARFAADRTVSRFLCPRSGRVPCDNALYAAHGMSP